MTDPVFVYLISTLAGSLGGFAAATVFIITRQRYMDEQALTLRKAARRLETASKLESAR